MKLCCQSKTERAMLHVSAAPPSGQYALVADVGPSSVCCLSRGHISKTKQDQTHTYYGTLLGSSHR